MKPYLNFNGMLKFCGDRSKGWGRKHLPEIPHLKLYDRLLFDPDELRAWIERTAERHNPIDVDAIVANALEPKPKRKGRAAR